MQLPQQVVLQAFGLGDLIALVAFGVRIGRTDALIPDVAIVGSPVRFRWDGRVALVFGRPAGGGLGRGQVGRIFRPVQQRIALHRGSQFGFQLDGRHLQQPDSQLELRRHDQMLAERGL